ncbi:signal transduction histidine kinase [Larkinella arboricola]|uniref:histidine kinase n=1 Tax=Larkinella arboricola TaxID=643671 RepID=A0A327WX87_LARAB|nr:HAMP domain-containing sensor histidine kinase [Larkinella arboricola]RAJ97406.1 signal transduction histidine kinase [Larkinella arboricola]
MSNSNNTSLTALAAYLAARREALLNNWRTICETDTSIHTVSGMSREEFNNKAPFMLNGLEQRLCQKPSDIDIKLMASEHGLHRWQKGYTLHELLSEMNHLSQLVRDELRKYWQRFPTTDMGLIAQSYDLVAWFSLQSINGSVEQYTELQRMAASSRTEALQKTLNELEHLSRQRGDLLRTSSHDLRSGFGVVKGAASLLELGGKSDAERKEMLEMLNRNLSSVHQLVIQLMDLARLEAGQESITMQRFDVSELLYSLVQTYQPMAEERGLMLQANGPAKLMIDGDPIQLQRIVQNLVLNALTHTKSGFISVSWTNEDGQRWIMSVQDSGPGLVNQQPGSFAEVLAPTVESTSAFGLSSPEVDVREAATINAPKTASSGEGIGLSIVKQLCELMGASLEIETQRGQGTLFRIRMPIYRNPPGS